MMINTPKTLVVICLNLLIVLCVLKSNGYYINITKSYPLGIYKSKDISSLETARGKLVFACVDPLNPVVELADRKKILAHGSRCPNTEIAPFLKRLVAVPGDNISVTEKGIEINGKLQNNSTLEFSYFSKLIHPGDSLVLTQNQYWIMSDYNKKSFDSRYFGAVEGSQIVNIAEPIWTL